MLPIMIHPDTQKQSSISAPMQYDTSAGITHEMQET